MARPALIPALQGRRILIVKDDYLMAQDLQAELEGAMGLLDIGPEPDGAVLDINLGRDMVYPLVDTLLDRHIRFVFATGYEGWSIPERYRDLPRLEKPLNVRQIAEALGTGQ